VSELSFSVQNFPKRSVCAMSSIMHFLVELLVISFVVLAQVHADLKDCTPPSSPVKINQIILTPNPPKIGQQLTINSTATINRPNDDGNAAVYVQYYLNGEWIDLPPLNVDYCSAVQCPIPAGKRSTSRTVDIPPIPSGAYRGNVTATETKTGQQLICVQFQYNLNE